MNLFPFVVAETVGKSLTFNVMNEVNELPIELIEAIKQFEIDVGETFEISECVDQDVAELITPAFAHYISEQDLPEEIADIVLGMTVYSAVFILESKHLVVFVNFDCGDSSGSDSSDESDVSDDEEEEWN